MKKAAICDPSRISLNRQAFIVAVHAVCGAPMIIIETFQRQNPRAPPAVS